VSRTPLREALGRLAAEGLVSFHPNRGAHVVDLTHEDVRAAYEARLVVEPGAARLAATRRPQAEIEAMLDAVAEQRRHDGGLASYRSSRTFHLALVRGSGNEYLVRTAEALWVPGIAQAIYERQAGTRDDTLADALEHERIVTAIAAGDPDLAEVLVRRHIASALHRLLGEV
jgi:DNA-binding GntR family transcriptional regulator